MKIGTILAASLFLISAAPAKAQKINIQTGIEVLKAQKFKCLEGKRVGLITNPTGVDNNLKSDIDILNEAGNVKLVALFAPEHGVRGNAHAGQSVSSDRDAATGIPVHSLFGKTRKATPEMLKDIDVLVYDIQDIGSRSFTYISTMGLAMEAAAENGKEFIVLDRPNPLGGNRVEGCLVENGFVSFVSQYPIPYVYGLTCGELALMLNGERMLQGGVQCNLKVIKMRKWKRSMNYAATGLQWIPSSPHIPHAETSYYYPASGIMGEFSYMSIGVGYTIPFEMFAAPWADAPALARRLNSLGIEGVVFRPVYAKPFYASFQGENIQGVQVHITDYNRAPLTDLQFLVAQEVAAMYPDKAIFKVADPKRFTMFDNVCGTSEIRRLFAQRNRWEDAKPYWYKDAAKFKQLSRKYYLYK